MTTSTLKQPPTHRPCPSADAIGGKLRGLRRRITLWLAIDGVCRVLLAAVALIGLDLLLDWTFSMDRPQRIVVMTLIIAALAVVAWRRLWRPLTRTMSDDALCLLVERRYQELGEGLISAVQLARQDADGDSASPTLVAATIERGVQSALPLPFHGVLRKQRFILNLLAVIALLAVLAGVAVAVSRTETMEIWFDRNIRLIDRPWPQDYYLTFDGAKDNVLRVPRAESWPLAVSVKPDRDGVEMPDDMLLELRGAGDHHSERMARGEGGRLFSGTLPPIDAPAQVRATAAGASTSWVRVEPVDRPLVTSLSLQVTPPKYTRGAPYSLEEGRGPYALLPGSRLHIRGVANKPLSQATISWGSQRKEMTLEGESGISLDVDYPQDAAGIYSITLTDREQVPTPGSGAAGPLSSRVPTQFTLRTKVDREPQVKLRLVGIGDKVTARARLPVTVAVDDDYAVAGAQLHWSLVEAAEGKAGNRTSLSMAKQDQPFGNPAIKLEHVVEVSTLKAAVGARLNLKATAVDNNAVRAGGPAEGSSDETTVEIVADDIFRAVLLDRERKQREDIERLLQNQLEVYADTKDLVRAGAEAKPWTAATEQAAAQVALQQKAIGKELAAAVKGIDDVLLEAANNRIEEPSGPLHQRLGKISSRLMEIAKKSVPDVTAQVETARRQAALPAERDAALAAALSGQERIEKELRDVLAHLVKGEDYQAILLLMRSIQDRQSSVHERARKQLEEQLKSLFERGSAGEPGAAKPR